MLKVILISAISVIIYSLVQCSAYNTFALAMLSKLVLFVGVPLLTGHNCKPMFAKSENKKLLTVFAALSVGIALVIIAGYALLKNLLEPQMILDSLTSQGITRSNFIVVFICIIFTNSFMEEFFFRGYIFFSLKDKTRSGAYIISSLIFALYHVTMLSGWFNIFIFILCMAGLFIGGLIFCYADEKCSNIWSGIFLHTGANLGINIIGLYLFLNS